MNSYLKKENAKTKNGSALIVVLCVLAVLMALSAALLVSTRSIINNNAKYTDVIQCKLLNQTLGKALSEQIIGVTDNEFGLAISKRIESGWTAEQVEIIEIEDDSEADQIIELIYRNTNTSLDTYELFMTVTTSYKNEKYAQTLRFTSYKLNNKVYWDYADTKPEENGGV